MGRRKKEDVVDISATPPPEQPSKGITLRPGRTAALVAPTRRVTIPLWEAKWNKEELEKKLADVQSRAFDRGYRQYPISQDELTWKPEWVERALDTSYTVQDVLDPKGPFAQMRRFGGVDLAIATAEKEGAFFVSTVIAMDQAKHFWILAQERHRGITFGAQISMVAQMHRLLNPEVWGVESNAYQLSFEQTLREITVPVRAIHTGALQKTDLEVGVPSLSVEFEQGRWHIPWGNETSHRLMGPLVEELFSYPSPGVHTDCIMSIFFCREMYRLGPQAAPSVWAIRF